MGCCFFLSFAAITSIVAKLCMGCVGAIALYCACFLYEDEEGRLQNSIVQLWKNIEEKRDKGESLVLAMKVADLVSRMLDRIFGPKVASWRMVGMSTTFQAASAGMIFLAGTWMDWSDGEIVDFETLILGGILSILSLTVACLAIKYAGRFWAAATLLPAIVAWVGGTLLFIGLRDFQRLMLLDGSGILAVLSDVLLIILIKRSLTGLAQSPSVPYLVMAILIQSGVLMWVLGLPVILVGRTLFASTLFVLNLPAGLSAVLFIVVLLFLILHRAFWPIACRLIYPVQRFQLVRNRKLMASLGIASFAIVSPPFSELLKKAHELFK